MVKLKFIKLFSHFITLYLTLLKLLSITSADKEVNSNRTVMSNESSHWEQVKDGTPKPFDKKLSFSDERYTLSNTTTNERVIRLENTSLLLSNVIIIGSEIMASGKMDYSVVFENSRFKNSEIVIDSASNVTIVYSHFIMEEIGKEKPDHVIKVYNTVVLFMTDTHFRNFENQSMPDNQYSTGHSEVENYTNLGIKLENVRIAELRGCTFTGIMADKNNGSAIWLKNSEILMMSCQLHFNIAKYGVIYGSHSVNITSRNSSFLFNFGKSGAVFYLINSCSLTNDGSIFQNNSAREHAGVVYATYDVTINNRDCLFHNNSAGSLFLDNSASSYGGVIYGKNNIVILNTGSIFLSNTGQYGGAIYLENWGRCINIDSHFKYNSVSEKGGAIYGWTDIEMINNASRFRTNTGQYGGAISVGKRGNCTNFDSHFQDNSVFYYGGAIYGENNIEIINTGSMFYSNRGQYGGVIYLEYSGRCINSYSIFQDNSVSETGGAIYGWTDIELINYASKFCNNRGESGGAISYSVRGNCTNTASHFLDNSASDKGGAIYPYTDVKILNNATIFRNNTGKWGGAIRMEKRGNCTNIDCSFLENSAFGGGGGIYGWTHIELINSGTRFLTNTGKDGGAIYIGDHATCINTDCTFQSNSASKEGGAIYGWIEVEIINNGTRFINNRADIHGGAILNQDRGKNINIDCKFIKNKAGASGGVMGFWRGINCTNINCNFTQNTGIFKIIYITNIPHLK